MRYGVVIASLTLVMLVGCNQSSSPKAKRGVPMNVDNGSRPLPSDHADWMASHAGTSLGAGGEVRLAAITLTAPKAWPRKQPRSSFIQAEFELPRAKGDEADGRLTVTTAGGSIEANITRWKGQFNGAQDNAHEEQIEVGGIKATLVDLSGDFNDQPGPFAPAVKRSDYRMIAAIIPVNGQLHFVKGVGPKKTMAAHAEEIKTFIRSVKKSE
jgi:hypothetical protein